MFDKILKFLKIKLSSALTLKDGTPLVIEGDLETGVNVYVVTSDGNVALPDGEYQADDMTIIMVKDGLIMDIIKPGTNEDVSLDPLGEKRSIDLAQNGNPDVTGDPNVMHPKTIDTTGTTTDTVKPVEDTIVEEVDPEEQKMADLEAKVAVLEQALADIMAKLNMISEKFSIATPIIKLKENTQVHSWMNPEMEAKVNLIKKLKKS